MKEKRFFSSFSMTLEKRKTLGFFLRFILKKFDNVEFLFQGIRAVYRNNKKIHPFDVVISSQIRFQAKNRSEQEKKKCSLMRRFISLT